MKLLDLPIKDIIQLDNSRTQYRENELSDLMQSIKQSGLIQPVGVRPYKNGKYELLFGNRRLLATKKLGNPEIRAVVFEKNDFLNGDGGQVDTFIMNLTENIQRKNINAADEGRYFWTLKELGLTESEIAARIGITRKRVVDSLTCYEHVPEKWRGKTITRFAGGVKRGRLSAATASKIINIKKTHRLGKKADQLFTVAAQDDVSATHINLLASLMSQGMTMKQALQNATSVKVLVVKIAMPLKTIKNLENRYEKPITQILFEHLASQKQFNVVRTSKSFRANTNRSRDVKIPKRQTVRGKKSASVQ